MKKINEIQEELKRCSVEQIPQACQNYSQDDRKGVQKLLAQYQKKWSSYQKELERTNRMWKYERENKEFLYICGIDEAGRGPLAGPVVAGAVILSKESELLYINDSKQLSERKREELYGQIMKEAISVGLGIIGPEVIDEINILQAAYRAMQMAVQKLSVRPDLLLNDAVTIPEIEIRQIPIVKGDTKSISIAAASIIAKVTRDRMMRKYEELFPEYGFASHKGYGCTSHIQAIKEYGPCPIHRKTFIKNFVTD